MAHKKGGGSTRNGRDSTSKPLGAKVVGGQEVSAGPLVGRQRGTKVEPFGWVEVRWLDEVEPDPLGMDRGGDAQLEHRRTADPPHARDLLQGDPRIAVPARVRPEDERPLLDAERALAAGHPGLE